MAAQFCRWDPPLKMIGLRFSNVMAPEDYAAFPGYSSDPRLRSWNAWGYIDARDGAQAVRLALELRRRRHGGLRDRQRRHGDDPAVGRPGRVVFPDVPFTRPSSGTETLLSIDKARRMLGYEPAFGWR